MNLPLSRQRAGFTLLELLVVLVVIGILASLALVRFSNVQEKAYRATMQSDLRNFATARAIHIAEDGDASTFAGINFSFSEFVFNAGYQHETTASWSLVVGHNKTATTCVLSTLASNGGAHTIRCAEDGNLAFTVNNTGPTTVSVDASGAIANLAFAGEASAFAALAASDADIQTVSWSWGDGTATAGTPAQAKTASHTYASGGDHTITLTLVKKDGTPVRGSETVDLGGSSTPTPPAVNVAPVALFTAPTGVVAGTPAAFSSSSTDSDGSIASAAWSFGDATASQSGASVSHTFATAGTCNVTLTVTDDDGATHAVTHQVSVAAPAPPTTTLASVGAINWWDGSWSAAQGNWNYINPLADGKVAFYSANWNQYVYRLIPVQGGTGHAAGAAEAESTFALSGSFQTFTHEMTTSTGRKYTVKVDARGLGTLVNGKTFNIYTYLYATDAAMQVYIGIPKQCSNAACPGSTTGTAYDNGSDPIEFKNFVVTQQ